MASISSLSSSSSSSSIYGNRSYNIISGLASGLDTEELISGLVQSYQQKIQSLQKQNTKYQWQQESIQSISDKLVEFSRNYTTFAYSNTNLASSSFFKNAVITSTSGTYANLISASGKSSSDIVVNSVKQLASAARYNGIGELSKSANATGTQMEDLGGEVTLSKLSGSLSLKYGNTSVSVNFGERDLFVKDGQFDADAFKTAIEDQLKNQQITTSSSSSSSSTHSAYDMIGVDVQADGSISFYDKSGSGNQVAISGASGNLANMIPNLDEVIEAGGAATRLDVSSGVTEQKNTAEYLADKSITVTLDGKSATYKLSDLIQKGQNTDDFRTALNEELKKTFGTDSTGQQRVSVSISDDKLSFNTTSTGSALSVTASDSGASKVLGLDGGVTNYVDTTKTLEQLGIDPGDGILFINGVQINETAYTKDTELSTILNDINSNTEAGVNVSYSKVTNEFVFTAKDTGSGGRIEIAADGGLGQKLFGAVDPDQAGSNYDPGKDAELEVSINGGPAMTLTRSSNSFDLDGMNITLNGTFTATTDADKVTFTSKSDADTIVNAVKKMVEDLNTIMKEVKNAYSTMPLQQSNGSSYEPLSDEDMADMSESAIANYEEKAKTGILFMDNDLSSLYNELRNAITSAGSDSSALRSIGLTTSYADGLTTLTFDEKTFREALESDPDKVQEAFTKSTSTGAATDGLMASLQKVTDRFASTTGDPKGILIEKAGSQYSPSAALDNTLLNKMQDIEEQISKWQDKMSTQVDYYTNKFTQLELLINQMNSQSSALAGLTGGY